MASYVIVLWLAYSGACRAKESSLAVHLDAHVDDDIPISGGITFHRCDSTVGCQITIDEKVTNVVIKDRIIIYCSDVQLKSSLDAQAQQYLYYFCGCAESNT